MKLMMRWMWLVLLVVFIAPVAAQPAPQVERAAQALEWVRTQQNADGSFNGFGLGSTADALIAIGSSWITSEDPLIQQGHTFIDANSAEIAAEPGVAAKYVIALLLTGGDPRAVNGTNLVDVLRNSYNAETNVYGNDVTVHSLAMLALVAAGEPVPDAAVTALQAFQLDDGSWSFSGDRTPDSGDTNTTALAIQALIAARGPAQPALDQAFAYLKTQQNVDGGFPYSQSSEFGTASDANSTALVLQAIAAAGQPFYAEPWADVNGNPMQVLVDLQTPSGAFGYTAELPEANAFATYQAIPAILLKPWPLAPVTPPTAAPEAPEEPTAPAPEVPVALPDTGAPAPLYMPVLLALGLGLFLIGLRTRHIA